MLGVELDEKGDLIATAAAETEVARGGRGVVVVLEEELSRVLRRSRKQEWPNPVNC